MATLPANFPTQVDPGVKPQDKIAELIAQYNAGNPGALDTAQLYGIKTSDIVTYLDQHPETPGAGRIRGDMMAELKVQAQYGNQDAKQFLTAQAAQTPTATAAPPPPAAPATYTNLAAPPAGAAPKAISPFATPGPPTIPQAGADSPVNLAAPPSGIRPLGPVDTTIAADTGYNPPYLAGPYGGPQPSAPPPADNSGGAGSFGGGGVGTPGITQGPIIGPPNVGSGPNIQTQTGTNTNNQVTAGTTSGTTAAQGTTSAAGSETTGGTGSRTLTPEEKAALTATLARLGITGQQADDLVTQATETSMKAVNDLLANPGYTDAEKAAIQVSPQERAAAVNLAEAPVTGAANAARDRLMQMNSARGGGAAGFNATLEEVARQEGRDASDAALKAGLSEDQAQRAANEAIAAARQQGSQFAGSLAQGQQTTQQNRQTAENDAITRLLTGAPEVNTATSGQKDTSASGTSATSGSTTGTTNQTSTGTGTDTSTRSTVPISPVITGGGSGIIGGQTVPNPGTVTYPTPGSTGTGASVKPPNITSTAPGTGGIPGLNVDMHTAPATAAPTSIATAIDPTKPAVGPSNFSSPTPGAGLSALPGQSPPSGTSSNLSGAAVNLAAAPQPSGGPTNLFAAPKPKKPLYATT